MQTDALLRYRPDWAEARARLTAWWHGEDIGRPLVQVSVPRETPWEAIPALPEPPGWTGGYSLADDAYRLNAMQRAAAARDYLGESLPAVAVGDLAPNCLALYLGCRGVEMPGTVWCEPCWSALDPDRLAYDADNAYWRATLGLTDRMLPRSRGRFLHQFPDFIEGLDTLAALRGTEELLEDLVERPDVVHACLRRITELYFHYYDVVYDHIRDEGGGSVFWVWGPGRTVKLQCDISAMLSPGMFREFMLPVLREMTERCAYNIYHWDGPGAICHLDALLELPRLQVIQWVPGAGAETAAHPRWWPLYHRILDAGKAAYLPGVTPEDVPRLKREFGRQSHRMILQVWGVRTRGEAEAVLAAAEG